MRMAAVLALACVAAIGASKKEVEVAADAVWKPAAQVLENIRRECTGGAPECFATKMAASASPAAVAFTESMGGNVWLRDFRKAGRVDIACVEYAFRANEFDGWLLVNGSPSPVDIDNLQKLPRAQMQESRAWSQLVAQHPNAALFPDDRTGTTRPLAIGFVDGSQQFVVAYKVRDGCRACADLGTAFLAWEFNPKGKLTATEFVDLSPVANGPPAQPIHINAGQWFTLALKGDAKHEWTLAQEPARWILKSAGQTVDKATGTVFWNFQTVNNGSTQMVLAYSSVDSSQAETLPLRVVVAPGLGH